MSARKTAAPRRRLTAEEARARILDAAERKLGEVGPESLRLTEVAAELGISHPAILHHFGSREELVSAVVVRAVGQLNERLAQALANHDQRSTVLFDLIAEFSATAGNARLIAWLVLSKRAPKPSVRAAATRPLQPLVELAHAQRLKANPTRRIDYDDTKFHSQLAALALLGDAVFGDLIRYATGDAVTPASSRAFRRRLAKLLA